MKRLLFLAPLLVAAACATEPLEPASDEPTTDDFNAGDGSGSGAGASDGSGGSNQPFSPATTGNTASSTASSTVASSSATTSGGGGAPSAGVCELDVDDAACSSCVKGLCCAELEACMGDADCACFAPCALAPGAELLECALLCGVLLPTESMGAVYQCLDSSCGDAC